MDNVIETGCIQGCIDNALHDSIAILFYSGSKPTILVVFLRFWSRFPVNYL